MLSRLIRGWVLILTWGFSQSRWGNGTAAMIWILLQTVRLWPEGLDKVLVIVIELARACNIGGVFLKSINAICGDTNRFERFLPGVKSMTS